MADFDIYGSDFSCLTGLDPILRLVSGSELMTQVAFRRLYCPPGGLFSSPNAVTVDVRDFLGQPFDPVRDRPRVIALCQAALVDDERIYSAQVTCSYDDGTLSIGASGTGSLGPFNLLLKVTAVTVEILRQQ